MSTLSEKQLKDELKQIRNLSSVFERYQLPCISDGSNCLSYYQQGNTCSNDEHRDYFAFSNYKYADEMALIAQIKKLIEECNFYINTIYTARDIARTLPFIPADLPNEPKMLLYKKVFDALTPRCSQLQALLEFTKRFNTIINKHLRTFMYKLEKKKVLWNDHIYLLLIAIDRCFVLDHINDKHTSFKADFSRYKRAFSFCRSRLNNAAQLLQQIREIHNFLNNPTQPDHIILWQLKQAVQSIPMKKKILAIFIDNAIDVITGHKYILPSVKYGMYRSILCFIYIIDDVKSNVNIFSKLATKYLPNIKEIRRLMRMSPVIPIFMDINTDVYTTLLLCDNFSKSETKHEWTMTERNIYKRYYIYDKAEGLNLRIPVDYEYTHITTEFCCFINDLRTLPKQYKYIELILYDWTQTRQIIPDIVIELIQLYFDHKLGPSKLEKSSVSFIIKCIKTISRWNCKMRE
eukprot:457733_1